MSRILSVSLVLAALLPGSQHDDEALPGTPTERALLARVSEERAQATVRTLVGFGPRMGGTRSGSEAAGWLLERFRAAGLTAEHVAGEPAWRHSESTWSVRAHVEGQVEPLVLARAWPWGYSPSAAGRAALSLEPAPGQVWLSARRSRARDRALAPAAVLIDGATTLDGSYPVVHHLPEGPDNPSPVFGLSRDEGARLRALLEAGRKVEIEFALEATIERATALTTVARLAPREGAPPGHLLFCAHGDSDAGGPGANDNGSGEAIVLEIASAWSEAVRAGALPAPPREVRFAILGTEIESSRDLLARSQDDGPILGVINFDQAGYGTGADQLNVEPDDLPANRELVLLIAGVLRDYAGRAGLPERWATNKSLGGTDSYVYSRSELFREHGRPAVTVYTSAWGRPAEYPRTPDMPGESWNDGDVVHVDYDNFYHSAGDTPENTTDTEPWNMGWCARVGLVAGVRWLDGLDAKPR